MKKPFAARRLAAVLLIILASTLTAQNASTIQVVITVIDPTGAVIPGAHIGIISLRSADPNNGDWLHYALHAPEQGWTDTDASGNATVGLEKGSYAISIAASGFKRYLERVVVRDGPSQALRATLPIGDDGCQVCVTPEITIPVEHASLDVFIPLEPLQTMTPPAVRVRRR